MKFSLDELVRISEIGATLMNYSDETIQRLADKGRSQRVRQAARHELTRRNLFKKGRGE